MLLGDKGEVCLWSKNVLLMVNVLFLVQDRYTMSLVNRNVMIATNQDSDKSRKEKKNEEID